MDVKYNQVIIKTLLVLQFFCSSKAMLKFLSHKWDLQGGMVRKKFNQIFQKEEEEKIRQNSLQFSYSFAIKVKPNNPSILKLFQQQYVPNFPKKHCPGEVYCMTRSVGAALSKMFRFVVWHDLIITKLNQSLVRCFEIPARSYWTDSLVNHLSDTLVRSQKKSALSSFTDSSVFKVLVGYKHCVCKHISSIKAGQTCWVSQFL